MYFMFENSIFNKDISVWDVSKVEDMNGMFISSQFNQNIDAWKINPKCDMKDMFYKSKMKEFPIWYK